MISSHLSIEQKLRPNFVLFSSVLEMEVEQNIASCSGKNVSLEDLFKRICEIIALGIWVDSTVLKKDFSNPKSQLSVVVLDPHVIEEFLEKHPSFQRVGVLIRREEIRYE